MNLQNMLEEALTKIESMSADEFEAECVRAGYRPVRKRDFAMSDTKYTIMRGVSYVSSIVLKSSESVEFSMKATNESTFQLAA